MTRTLNIAGGIPVAEYASQGNAILGIRGSGKSYTATFTAEQLHAADVPFIAFDPIGMWHWLRVPEHGAAVPVLIVGGKYADIPLTPEDAPDIVRALMRLRLSAVFDLYSMELSKADWRRIVQSSVRTLLYENEPHGLRHLFLEEAAEFIPQKVGGEHAGVYSEMEKLARMGGNARLGYTLINQRAEEVNKAVLELADCLILHRQKGKNSLLNLSKWLDVADLAGGRAIIKSLPGLPAGDCWVWSNGAEAPVRFHVPQKRTHHPDRKHTGESVALKGRMDMRREAQQVLDLVPELRERAAARDPTLLLERIRVLEGQLAGKVVTGHSDAELQRAKALGVKQGRAEGWNEALDKVAESLAPVRELARLPTPEGPPVRDAEREARAVSRSTTRLLDALAPTGATRETVQAAGLKLASRKILQCLAQYKSGRTRTQLAIITGYASTGGGFKNALSELRTRELIASPTPDLYCITPEGRQVVGDRFAPLPTGKDLVQQWMGQLKKAERGILGVLYDAYPRTLDRADIARLTDYDVDGGGFKNALSRLRTLELIAGASHALGLSPAIFGD